MATCTLCDLPTEADPHTDPAVEGTYCCRGCLSVAASLDDVDAGPDEPDAWDGPSTDSVAPDVDRSESRRRGGGNSHSSPDAIDGEMADVETAHVEAADSETADVETGDAETTFLHVDGMHCSTCEAFLERTARDVAGVERVRASYATDTMRVDYDPAVVSADDLPDRLSHAGYAVSDRADPVDGTSDDVVRFLIGGGFFGMMAMLWYVLVVYPTDLGYEPLVGLGGLAGPYLFAQIWVFASVVLFYTGAPILRGAYVSLRGRQPNMDLLVGIAVASSYVYSTVALVLGRTDLYFDVTIAVVLVVVAGKRYETRIKERATGHLSDLTGATETTVRRASGETVAADAVDPGDRLLVRPGERLPFDGTVVEGRAAVDEALVTGESLPATKREGDDVRGGTIVTDAPLVVAVDDPVSSTLDDIVRLQWDIQSARTGIQRLVDRLATVFVPLVLVIAAVAGAWVLVRGGSPTGAALVSLTVLIVTCPCALGLATPLAVAAGVRDAARRGIVIVSDAVFEDAAAVDAVVLDKTGTLTDGEMRVLDVVAPAGPDRSVLATAAALERASSHPVAEAVVRAADGLDAGGTADDGEGVVADGGAAVVEADATEVAPDVDVADVTVLNRGVRGTVDGVETRVGHERLFGGAEWSVPDRLRAAGRRAERNGRVPVFVGRDGTVDGVVVVGDRVRDDWDALVTHLAATGRDVVVLTGDSPAAVRQFEDHPAVDEVFAGVPPAAKAATVRRVGADRRVAMVGDGSNDAPALAAADLGIAVASGTDIAADAADAVLLSDRLLAIPDLFAVTRGTNRRIRENLGWALVYNTIAIPVAAAGLLTPLVAAVAMATSSLLVVSNSARTVVDE